MCQQRPRLLFCLLLFAKRSAILPMVVVLPTPLTPITNIIDGFVLNMQLLIATNHLCNNVFNYTHNQLWIGDGSFFTRVLNSAQIFSAVGIPTSPMTYKLFQFFKQFLISFSVKELSIEPIEPEMLSLVFFNPCLILLKKPISSSPPDLNYYKPNFSSISLISNSSSLDTP